MAYFSDNEGIKVDGAVYSNLQNGYYIPTNMDLVLSFDNGTRTFTVTPSTEQEWVYFQGGIRYSVNGSVSLQISNVEGLHALYFEDGVLKEVVNPSIVDFEALIIDYCLITYVYWDFDNQEHNYFANEKHGVSMAPETHNYLHFTQGAKFLFGLGLGDIDADSNGDLDTSAQFSTASGAITDEDNFTNIPSIGSTVGLPIYYLDGATPNLRRVENAGFSMITTGSGRLAFNENVGGNWQLSEISNNDFVLCHVFAINGADGYDKMIAFMGQNDYPTAGQARAGAESEIETIVTLIPIQEKVTVATLIFQTSNGYDNGIKARIRSTDTGEDYVDWRQSANIGGGAPTSHNNLSDLQTTSSTGLYQHINAFEALEIPQFTTAVRDTLTPTGPAIIFNTTTNQFEKYISGVWSAL